MQAVLALIPNYLQEVVGLGLSSIGDLGGLSTLAGALLRLVFDGPQPMPDAVRFL